MATFYLSNPYSAFAQRYYAPLPPKINMTPDLTSVAGITLAKRVDEVNLSFTVTDKKGHFIRDLSEDDFQVFDNQLAPEGLRFFQQQTDLPLRVVLLIDASDSIKDRFHFEQNAALVFFLKKILRPGLDEALVATFQRQHYTADRFYRQRARRSAAS